MSTFIIAGNGQGGISSEDSDPCQYTILCYYTIIDDIWETQHNSYLIMATTIIAQGN